MGLSRRSLPRTFLKLVKSSSKVIAQEWAEPSLQFIFGVTHFQALRKHHFLLSQQSQALKLLDNQITNMVKSTNQCYMA